MVMSGADVCCSVVFGTLVGVFVVFSVMGSELLMTSAISCPLWSSVYECQRVYNNKQFELFEFVSGDLQYDEISLTFTAGYVCVVHMVQVFCLVQVTCLR